MDIGLARGSPSGLLAIQPASSQFVSGRFGDHGRRAGRYFGGKSERVRLQNETFVRRHHLELVARTGVGTRDEQLPHPRVTQRPHRVQTAVPEVPVPHDADRFGIGRPHGESRARYALVYARVGAEHFPQPVVAALVEQVQVKVSESRPQPVRVVEDEPRGPGRAVGRLQPVAGSRGVEVAFPQPGRMDLAHGHPLQDIAVGSGAGDQQVHLAGGRAERRDQPAVTSKQGMRVVMAALDQELDLLGVEAGLQSGFCVW